MDHKEHLEVGKASYEALQHARGLVKEGAKLFDVAESIESFIEKKGFGLSFPVNISVNSKAAHYTPSKEDDTVFKSGDLVKVDVGARKGTCLGDCAVTVDISGNNTSLVEAAEESLEAALGVVKAGVQLREIGKAIERVVTEKGVFPVRNLGGHGITSEELHADVFIANFDNGDTTRLLEGQVISIEPFVTDGAGYVQDSDEIQIFQKVQYAIPRSQEARQILSIVDERYLTYPFAIRWLEKALPNLSGFGIRKGIQELVNMEVLETFPVLVEEKGGLVAQAEKELIVEKDGYTLLTK